MTVIVRTTCVCNLPNCDLCHQEMMHKELKNIKHASCCQPLSLENTLLLATSSFNTAKATNDGERKIQV